MSDEVAIEVPKAWLSRDGVNRHAVMQATRVSITNVQVLIEYEGRPSAGRYTHLIVGGRARPLTEGPIMLADGDSVHAVYLADVTFGDEELV